MTAIPGLPMKRHNVGPDLEVRVVAVVDEASQRPALDVRLHRRSPAEASGGAEAFHETSAGLRIPLHLAPVIAEDLMAVARRAAQVNVVSP